MTDFPLHNLLAIDLVGSVEGALLALMVAAGLFLIVWGGVHGHPRGEHRCPRCRYDLRCTPPGRCPECGVHAGEENAVRRRRGRNAMIAGVLIPMAFPLYPAVMSSRAHGWTPPLPPWRGVESEDLPHGFRVERRRHRDPTWTGYREACRLSWPGGEWTHPFNRLSLGATDPDDPNRRYGLGDDVTGDGIANLIIHVYGCGAQCCQRFRVLELRPGAEPREIARIDAGHGGGFADVDGDGRPEFVGSDWSAAEALTCFSCFQYPRIVMRYEDGAYVLATDLMRRPPPTPGALDELAAEITRRWVQHWQSGFDLLWGEMLSLVYSGNDSAAWDLFERACPGSPESRASYRAEFALVLDENPYRRAIVGASTDTR